MLDGGVPGRLDLERSERGRRAVHRGRDLLGIAFRGALDRSGRDRPSLGRGIQQDVELTFDVLSADGDQAIIHWHVFTRNVGDPVRVEYDGVLVVRFAPDGRCSEHREWYFRRELPA